MPSLLPAMQTLHLISTAFHLQTHCPRAVQGDIAVMNRGVGDELHLFHIKLTISDNTHHRVPTTSSEGVSTCWLYLLS